MPSIHDLPLLAGQPFQGIPWWIVCAVTAIYFVAFVLRGALGFGAIAPAVVLTSLLIPPHHAILLAVIAATIPQLQLLPEGVREGDWDVARPVLAAMTVTVPIGVWLFSRIESDWLNLVLGGVISVLVILEMTKALERAASRVDMRSHRLAFGLSAITGFINGVTGSGGIITLVLYLRHACRDHISLRGTATLIGTLLLAWRLIVTAAAGLITIQLLVEALLLLPFVYLGVHAGRRFFRSLSPARYHKLLQAILLVSATGLIIKGLVDMS